MIKEYYNIHFSPEKDEKSYYNIEDIESIRKDISNGNVVILKSFFTESSMIELRENVYKSFLEYPFSNPELNRRTKNFQRRDENPVKSAVKRTKQFLVSFYWNRQRFNERDMFLSLTYLRNKVAKLPDRYASNCIEQDGYLTYPNITHYPAGGGMLNKHIDPPSKQFCVIIAAMSERGRDFTSGGVYFFDGDDKVDLEASLKIGDVYLMNPSIPHGVELIEDSQNTYDGINWAINRGRWILFPALIEAASLRGKHIEGLKDLGEK